MPLHEKYDKLQCPYDASHKVDAYRFQIHLIKCSRSHPEMDLVPCPFNATHHVERVTKRHHMANCPDRIVVGVNAVEEARRLNQDGTEENLHGDLSVPAYHNNLWDKADFHDDWDNERDHYSEGFFLHTAESQEPETLPTVPPRHSQFSGQELRRPKEAPQAAFQSDQPQPWSMGGRGRGRPPVSNSNDANPGRVNMNGVNGSARVNEDAELLRSLAIGRGIGRGIPVESVSRAAPRAANVPNFSLQPSRPAASPSPPPSNGVAAFNAPAPVSIARPGRGRGSIYGAGSAAANGEPIGTSPWGASQAPVGTQQAPIGTPQAPIGTPRQPSVVPRATNVPGFTLPGARPTNVPNFNPAAQPATVPVNTSGTEFFLRNGGIGRGAPSGGAGPEFVVPNLNMPRQAMAPPPGFGRGAAINVNGNNNQDPFAEYENRPAPGAYAGGQSTTPANYGSYAGGYMPASSMTGGYYAASLSESTASLTDSTSSDPVPDSEEDEETRRQKEIRRLQKKLRDIVTLENKRKQGKPLNSDQKDKLSKKREVEDLLMSLRLN